MIQYPHRVFTLLVGLVMALAIAGCGPGVKLPKLPGDAVVLAYGDSLTFGTGTTPDKSYPAALERKIGLKVGCFRCSRRSQRRWTGAPARGAR